MPRPPPIMTGGSLTGPVRRVGNTEESGGVDGWCLDGEEGAEEALEDDAKICCGDDSDGIIIIVSNVWVVEAAAEEMTTVGLRGKDAEGL